MTQNTDSSAEILNVTTSTERTRNALSVEDQAAILLWKICPPCLLLLGGFGNIATIFVMRRIEGKNSSQHVILMALAVADLTLLYVGLLNRWVIFLFHVDVSDLHVVVCKLSRWVIYATGTMSSWLLTGVTVQRTMAVKWPHKMMMMCSLQRTWTVVAVVVTVACALHCHLLFGMVTSDNRCRFRSVWYQDFVLHVWAWVDLATLTFLPTLCLAVCDVMLSLTLFKATTSGTSMTMTSTSSDASHINASRRRTASRTTVMILALSCAFLVLTMPVCVFFIWDYYVSTHSSSNSDLWTKTALSFAVTHLLWYTNSSVNFLLYCFTGTKFRGEFLRWISCGARSRPKPSISN